MSEQAIINRDNKLSQSEDFSFLKKEGLKLIEKLSGKVWNDYNTHDPGITLLEAFCYALTDVGYRTSFAVEDVLASNRQDPPKTKNDFYTAAQILPVNPVTLNDFRKLVIDTKGVRNAWIETSENYEIPIYIDLQKDEKIANGRKASLTYDARRGDDMLGLRGLYKVFVEYENKILEESREEEVAEVIRKKLRFHRNLCEDFLSVSSVEYELFAIEAVLQVREGIDIEKVNAQVYAAIYDYFSPPVLFYSLEQMLEKGYSSDEIFEGPVLKYGFIDTKEMEKSERYKKIHLSDIISRITDIEGVIAVKKLALPVNSESPFSDFTDWIDSVKAKQRAFRLDLENSTITFVRSGDRYRDNSNKHADQKRVKGLFSFIQSTRLQLKLKGLGGDIKIPEGEDMSISEFFPMQSSLPDAYKMSETYLDIHLDKATIFRGLMYVKGQLDVGARSDLANRWKMIGEAAVKVLGKSLTRINEEGDISEAQVLAVKNEYRIRQICRLDKRSKQALQLRGFLMVFEQILADSLSQLSNVGKLLSFADDAENPISQTYFPQPLQGIKDLEYLFIDYNKYKDSLLEITETEDEFYQRRNKILDHLIARFSETLDKYSFFMQTRLGNHAGSRIISDKIRFLSDYIAISNYRGKGFDYSNTINAVGNAWDSDNVEGFKKRICRLLGIEQYTRKSIAPTYIVISKRRLDNDIERYFVTLIDPDMEGDILLETIDGYETEGEANEILNYILEHGADRDLYEKEVRKDKCSYKLRRTFEENRLERIATTPAYSKESDGERGFEKTFRVLEKISQYENFHVLEHILLRPKMPPRQRNNKKGGAHEDSDIVRLLPALAIPANQNFAETRQEAAPFKFNIINVPDSEDNSRIMWRLGLIKEDSSEVLKVEEYFLFYNDLTRRIENIKETGADGSNYEVSESADGYFIFKIVDRGTVLATSRKNYRKKEDLQSEVERLVEFFSYENISAEEEKVDDDLSSYADPYSFQVSIFIPAWPVRFRDPTFKHLLEKTIYHETPSHVYPHVYWLDHARMKQFEEAYRLWIEEFTTTEIPNTEVVNNLILVLNEVRNNE